MKKNIINGIAVVGRWTHFLIPVMIVVLMMPAVGLAQSPAVVNLGSTANYAILAGSLISNIPTSAITGDIGLSPAAGSNITGFGATEITGKIYTVDATGPVGSTISPTLLTAAKGDLTIAYNSAAGRTPIPTGSFLNPGSGNIGGLSLVPGLYKFTSGASITGSDVTLTGSATDVWIFQIAAALNVGTGVKVVLAGNAKAANIFWQVGTSATLGTNCVFKGTIMADQSISLNTGASVEGRLLASSAAVTLASSTVTVPATPAAQLTVVSTVPANNAKNVPLQTIVSLTFSSALDTVAMKNMKDSRLSNIINTGSEYYSTDAKTLSVSAQLDANTSYFVAFFFAKGKDGSIMQGPFVYYFTTGSSFPSATVSGTVLSGTTGVSPQNSIVALSTTTLNGSGGNGGNSNPNFVAWANVNNDGTFTIPYVPNGILYPVAAKDVDLDGQIKPELGVDVAAIADSITITGSSVTGVILTFMRTTVSVAEVLPVLSEFSLAQNYPNPFNPTTIIQYQLPRDGVVKITVFDALGREIQTVVNEFKSSGSYSVEFNAGTLPSGVYFYRLEAGSFASTKKLILMK